MFNNAIQREKHIFICFVNWKFQIKVKLRKVSMSKEESTVFLMMFRFKS